jgi:hypothetical protein
MESSATISNSSAFGDVTTNFTDHVQAFKSGGLVGFSETDTRVIRCSASGAVTGIGAGGLIGWCDGSIEHCTATGNVTGVWETGGLAGSLRRKFTTSPVIDGTITFSSAKPQWVVGTGILGNTHCSFPHAQRRFAGVGGLVGYCFPLATILDSSSSCAVVSPGEFVGGLVGFFWNSRIERCASFGSVSANESRAGGLIGGIRVSTTTLNASSIVRDSYSKCSVNYAKDAQSYPNYLGANTGFGGLIGSADAAGISYPTLIERSYSTGMVTMSTANPPPSTPAVGGLVGYVGVNTTTTSSYWDMDSSGLSGSAAGSGRTTTQMHDAATFVGWNFTTIWNIVQAVSYPFLR